MNKKYQLVIILIIIALSLGIIKLIFGYRDRGEVTNLITMIPPTPTPVVDSNYQLWEQLPYSGKGFTIDRYLGPKQLAIKVKGIDKKIVEKKVIEWLVEQKVATESYKLVFE